MKSYPEKSFSLNFGYPFASRGCLQFRLGNVLPKVRLYFSSYLLTTTANVNKPNRFCYHVQKFHGFRENIVSVNNSFHISYYVCWSVVTRGCLFTAVLYNLCQKNNNVRLTVINGYNHEKSIVSIWHSNLVYRFSPISVINR